MELPRRFEPEAPRRVVVLGPRGSGRVSLATLLSRTFGLAFADLDAALAQATTPESRSSVATSLSEGAFWVMPGNDLDTLDIRVRRADWLVFLDLPGSACFIQLLKREMRRRFGAAGANTPGRRPLTWKSLRETLNFQTHAAPRILRTIERERRSRTIFILRSHGDIQNFIANLSAGSGTDNDLTRGRKPRA